jgi:hypothetical protein
LAAKHSTQSIIRKEENILAKAEGFQEELHIVMTRYGSA